MINVYEGMNNDASEYCSARKVKDNCTTGIARDFLDHSQISPTESFRICIDYTTNEETYQQGFV